MGRTTQIHSPNLLILLINGGWAQTETQKKVSVKICVNPWQARIGKVETIQNVVEVCPKHFGCETRNKFS